MPVQPEDVAQTLAYQAYLTYGDAEDHLLRVIARRLARGVDEPGWATYKLTEVQALKQDAFFTWGDLEGGVKDGAAKAVDFAYNAGVGAATGDLQANGVPAGFTKTSNRAVAALTRSLVDRLGQTQLRVVRFVEDTYRGVISEVARGTVTGVQSRREATADALRRFADRGITGFVDRAGRSWDLASYAEMATRTVTGQAMVQGHVDQLQAHGRNLVMVSDAPEECEVCRPFEGKVLALTPEAVDQIPDGQRLRMTLSQAVGAGLFHPNCRHRTVLYIPGVTKPLHDTADVFAGDVLRPTQRQYERDIRALKRRQVIDSELNPKAGRLANARLRGKQAEFKAWREEHNRKNLAYRTSIKPPPASSIPKDLRAQPKLPTAPPTAPTPAPPIAAELAPEPVPRVDPHPKPADLEPDPELADYTDSELQTLMDDAAQSDDPAGYEFTQQAARELDRRTAAGGKIVDADRDAEAWKLSSIRKPVKPQKQLLAETRSDYDDLIYRTRLDAEAVTNGNLVRRTALAEFQRKYGTFDALFTGSANRAFYYASEELLRYWEQNPRLTFAEFATQAGVQDAKLAAAARKAPGVRSDAALRAQENYDPERRKAREKERRERARRRRGA